MTLLKTLEIIADLDLEIRSLRIWSLRGLEDWRLLGWTGGWSVRRSLLRFK